MRQSERAVTIFLCILGAALLSLALWVAENAFVAECVRSGHTQGYCEMEFWK